MVRWRCEFDSRLVLLKAYNRALLQKLTNSSLVEHQALNLKNGFDSRFSIRLCDLHGSFQDVGKFGIPSALDAEDRWFKSSHPDLCD